jgi:hypothetical protein
MGTDGSASADAVVVVGAGELNTLVESLLIVVPLPGRGVSDDILVRTAGIIAVERNLL